MAHDGPRLAVIGTFDTDRYGDALYPRIVQAEVRRRCLTATVNVFAPVGSDLPARLGGRAFVEPLGPPTEARRADIASAHDLLVIGGGALLHDDAAIYSQLYAKSPHDILRLRPWEWFCPVGGTVGDEAAVPMAWNALGLPLEPGAALAARVAGAAQSVAYVAVRDERAAREVRRHAPSAGVHVVPDTLLVVDRLFADEVLARRVRYLRALGRYPLEGPVLVQPGAVTVERDALRHANLLVPALARGTNRPIAVLDVPPHQTAQAVAARLAARLGRPISIARTGSVEDVAAAIRSAMVFIGASLDTVLTALAYGVPVLSCADPSFAAPESVALIEFAEWGGFAEVVARPGALDLERVLSPPFRRRLAGARERLRSLIDRHFDAIVALALQSWERRSQGAAVSRLMRVVSRLSLEARTLREAHQALTERLLEERLRFAELLGPDAGGETVSTFVDLRDRVEWLERTKPEPAGPEEVLSLHVELARCRDELARLRADAGGRGR